MVAPVPSSPPPSAAELAAARTRAMLDRVLDAAPAASALELDREGNRFLDYAADRIPRICRVPASPGRADAARPNERFELVSALGLLDEPHYQREFLLQWAHQRLGYRGRLLVSSRGGRQGVRDAYRRLRLHQGRLLGPDEAEDLLADAGFQVLEIDVAHRWGRLGTPALVVVAIRS